MSVYPGGKQQVMRDGWWGGKLQKMNYSLRIPKGMRAILENTHGMNADKIRKVLGSYPGFVFNWTILERRGHIVYMLPKFYCELNSIKWVWAQLKRYTKTYCKYSIMSLRNLIIPALEMVTLENILNYFRKVRHYMFAHSKRSVYRQYHGKPHISWA